MADEFFCRGCKRELTGVIITVQSVVEKFVYTVHEETPDCNWRLCRGCKSILCKDCDDAQRYFCCDEGFVVARERAAEALKAEPEKHAMR